MAALTTSNTYRSGGTALVRAGAGGAALLTAHAALNARLLRTPPHDPPPIAERVSLLLPLRDEVHRVTPCLQALLGQQRLRDVELLVLDDGSTDGTAELVRQVAGDRARILTGAPLHPGWLGKPWACAQLAEAATGDVLVFLDADVVLAPAAVARTVTLLRDGGLELVSPYPRQRAETPAERLVQPLLQWSWLTFLPLRLAERSPRPSLAAANGQLLGVDAAAYRTFRGHGAVAGEVVDDVALLRALKRAGFRVVVADGTDLAVCRMYASWAELRDGYSKSLWSAYGSPLGAVAGCALLTSVYVLPPLAALRGSKAGALGYAAAVAGRVLTARRTGGRTWPDPLGHPLSVLLLCALTARSWWQRAAGTLTWKGRRLP
ncbi:MAG: glycosyltransferase [Frankiaceae bacterium]